MSHTLVIEFEGWYQYRLPTDPDPTDEPRGSSGYTFALGDEPDLDRILRFQIDPRIPTRSFGPDIGVSVKAAHRIGPTQHDVPDLLDAKVDLLGEPMLVNRNWILTLPGYEPIVPFRLSISAGDLVIEREAPIRPDHPDTPIIDIPEDELTAYGARGLSYEPDTVAPATGIWDPLQHYQDRRRKLGEERRRLIDGGADPNGPTIAIIDGRLSELDIGIASGGADRRIGVRHVVERFGFDMHGKIHLTGDEEVHLGGCLSDDPKVPWRVDFWMGGFDPDALCAFVHGALRVPYAPADGPEVPTSS